MTLQARWSVLRASLFTQSTTRAVVWALTLVGLLVAVTPAEAQTEGAVVRAETWLLGQQNPDGSFGVSRPLAPRDTAAAVVALGRRGTGSPELEAGLVYLVGVPDGRAEVHARRIRALAAAGRPIAGLEASLLGERSASGFGAFGGHEPNLFDTALALGALGEAEETYLFELASLLDALQLHQNPDGGWGYGAGDASGTYFTAEISLALASLDRLAIAPEVTAAAAGFLVSRQQSDGSFGSILETALAYRALVALGWNVGSLPVSPVDSLLATQRADGSWEQDVFVTAQALLALGGEAPDLVVSDLVASPESVLPGESIQLTATVTNRGTLPAPASSLVVRDGAGVERAALDVAALDPGAQIEVGTTLEAAGATDELLLTAVADGVGVVDEISEANNERTVRVAIAAEPDLALYGSDLSVAPERPVPGQPATLRVSVRNQGGTTVDAFSYRVSELVAGLETTVLAEGTAGPAAPGAGTLLDLPFTLPEGEHLLRVEVDREGAVAEADETNNRAEIAFFVTDDRLPDFSVSAADLTATPDRPAAGETVALDLVVHNLGARDGVAEVAFYDGDPASGSLVHTTSATVSAGDATPISASFVLTPETRFVTALVDPAGAVAELSEINNRVRRVLVDLPDLAVGFDNLELSPVAPLPGETVLGVLTVRNAGTAPAAESVVEVRDADPGSGGTLVFQGTLPPLQPGANTSLDFSWTAVGGLRTLSVVVDPAGSVTELSEVNNTTLREVAVPRENGPNLFVDGVDLSGFDQDPLTLRAAGTVAIRVVNGGDGPAGESLLRLFEDRNGDGRFGGSTSGDVALASTTVPPLAVGDGASVPLDVDATLSFRSPLVWAEVDATGVVSEQREDDNRRALFGDCRALPAAASFDAVEEWWLPGLEVETAPAVVQLGDDNGDGVIDSRDVPDVVFHTEDAEGRAITARSGLDGSELWTVRSTPDNPVAGRLANLAAADLDGDGVAEVIGIRSDRRVLAIDHRGGVLWVSDLVESAGGRNWAGAPAVGDLDGDGVPEIAVGRSVLSNTGRLIAQGTANVGRNRNYYGPFGVPYLIDAPLSAIADVDLDGRAELVAGDALYRLVDGTLQVVWDRTVPDHLMVDGFVAVADLDADPESEIVYVSSNQVMVLNHDGSVAAPRRTVQPYVPFGNRSFWAGPPSVGDLDGDGAPEILISTSRELFALRSNLATFWHVPTSELSEMAGAVPFDLDGDGAAEVVYQDQTELRILDGATGQTLYTRPNTSKTGTELPVVADVDGDGRAEILVPSNRSFGGDGSTQGLHVLGHPSWRGARPIWNQHTFRGTNVLLDGTVPAAGAASLRPGGRFRSNLALPAPEPVLPNSTLGLPRVGRATADGVPVTVRVGNGGLAALPPGLRVVLYTGDPAGGGAPVGEALTAEALRPGRWTDVTVLWQMPGPAGSTIWAVVDPDDRVVECDEADNRLSFVIEESVLPDLAIPAGGVVPGAPLVEGQRVPVAIRVENAGAAEATGFTVRLFDGDPAAEPATAEVGEATVGSLAPGETVTVEILWESLGAGTGIHRLHAVADAEDLLLEPDEANNLGLAEIDLVAATEPDLAVERFTVEPAAVEAGADALFRVEVLNRGTELPGGVEAGFLVNRAEVGRSASPATLATGDRVILELPVSTVGRQGLLEAEVRLDPDGRTAEVNETNNRASADLRVDAASLALAVATDRLSYDPGGTVALTVTTESSGPESRAAALRLTIVDSAGTGIARPVDDQPITLPPGSTSFSFTWETGSHLPGGYSAVAELLLPQGAAGDLVPAARAETLFSVARQVVLGARLYADRDVYPPTGSAVLTGRVTSDSANTILDGLTTRLLVIAPSGAELFAAERALPVFYPGSEVPVEGVWEVAGSPAGTYTARLELRDRAGLLLAYSETALSVEDSAATGAGLTGELVVAPPVVGIGAPVRFDVHLTNGGNADLESLVSRVDLVRLVDGTVADSVALRRGLPRDAEAFDSLGLPTGLLAPGDYLATLVAVLPGGELRLDRAALTLAPGVSVADAVAPEGDAGSASLSFPVTLSEPLPVEVRVAYATADGTAVAGEDYAPASGTLLFAPGETAQAITVEIFGDQVEEADEVLLVTLDDPVGVLPGDAQALGVLRDEEGCPSPNLLANGDAEEGSADDPVPGWFGSAVGWTARAADPTPIEGAAAFGFTGEAAGADLVQTVDLSPFAATIDAGAQAFLVEGFVYSAVPSDAGATPDAGRVVVEYLDAGGSVLDRFDSGDLASPGAWRAVTDLRPVPAGARSARVLLGATRNDGTGLDVAFDRVGLRSVGTPVLAVADASTLEGDAGTASASFSLSLSCVQSTPVRLDWVTADGTATAGADYRAASGTLTLAAGETAGTIEVPVLGDGVDEPDETFSLSVSSPDGVVVLTPTPGATVLDDDGPARLSVLDLSFAEGDGAGEALVTVTLSDVSGKRVSVGWSTAGDSATAGVDYTASSGTVTLEPGETEATLRVPVAGDRLNEPDEIFLVRLSSPVAAELARAEATVTLVDDDPVEVVIGDASVVEGDPGTVPAREAHVPVTLSVPSVFEVAVDWSTADRDAVAGVDYQAASGTLTIPAGETVGEVVVPIVGDTVREPVESFLVTLGAAVGASLGDPEAVVSIIDDDGILVSVDDLTVREGAGAEALVQVTLNKAATVPVAVDFATVEASAVPGADYLATAGAIEIPAGATAVQVPVEILDDALYEPTEHFELRLSNPSGDAILLDDLARVKLLDDDGWFLNGDADDSVIPGCIVVAPDVRYRRGSAWQKAPVDLTQSFDKTMRVYLGDQDSGGEGAYFSLQNQGPSALGGSGGSEGWGGIRPSVGIELDTNTDLRFFDGADHLSVGINGSEHGGDGPVELPVFDIEDGEEHELRVVWNGVTKSLDLHFDGSEVLVYDRDLVAEVFGGVSEVLWGMTGATANVPNLEYFCDSAACTPGAATLVSVGDTRVVEGDAGTVQLHFPVTLSCPSSGPVTASYATADGTATAGADYLPTSGTLTFQPGETSKDVVVDVVGELHGEASEELFLDLAEPVSADGTAEIRYGRGTGTILTDEASVAPVTGQVLEGTGGTVTAPVYLDLAGPVDFPVKVSWTIVGGTATPGVDFLAQSGTLTFQPGEVRKGIPVRVVADGAEEPTERLFVELAGSDVELEVTRFPVDLIDDDTCPSPNLLMNGGAEEPLVNGEVPGWTEVVSDAWVNTGGFVSPLEGGGLFYASERYADLAELRQDVDLSTWARTVDAGVQEMVFSGAVRSRDFGAGVVDSARVVVEYRDAAGTVLDRFDTGETRITSFWAHVGDRRLVPPGTRTARVRLISDRVEGYSVDGYYDQLVLAALGTPSISVGDTEVLEGELGTVDAVFPVTLTCVAPTSVQVDYLTSDGSARAGSDYEATTGTLTIPAGSVTGEIGVPVRGDSEAEGAETFLLHLVAVQGAGVDDAEAVGTILPDETFVSIADTSVVEGGVDPSDATAQASFVVSLSSASPLPITVSYATTDGTAVAGADYQAVSGTLTFEPGTLERTVTVPVVGDGQAEGDETFSLVLSEPRNATLQAAESHCTIVDDDIAISIADAAAIEGSSGTTDALFRVTLSVVSSEQVTVSYGTRPLLASEGGDYLKASGTVTFAPGEVATEIAVAVVGDGEVEPSETFEVYLFDPVHGGILDGEAIGTIIDDDNCPGPNLLVNPGAEEPLAGGEIRGWVEALGDRWTVRSQSPAPYAGDGAFEPGTTAEAELRQDVDVSAYAGPIDRGAQSFLFEGFVRSVVAAAPDRARVVVEYRDGANATVLDTYDSGEVLSPDGWSQLSDLRVAPPGTRRVRVRLLAYRSGTEIVNDALFDGLVLRSIGTPVIEAGRGAVVEGDGGTTVVEVPVRLVCPAETGVGARYRTVDASAVAGLDYLSTAGSLTFAPGETLKTVPVTVLGDMELELEETVSLEILDPQGAVVVDPLGTGAILDDDNAGASTREIRTFWIEDLRIFAWADDTEVTLIDIDTGKPLSMNDGRIRTANVSTNPFVLKNAGDSFEGRVYGNIRLRIVAGDPSGTEQLRPITVWTGELSAGLRHPATVPIGGNPWASYLPSFSIRPRANGRELGDRFLGFTSRDLTLFVRKGLEPTRISIEDLATNADLDSDDSTVLDSADATYADETIEIYHLDGFEDDTIRISSNRELSALVGISTGTGTDWTVSPPSYTLGDDGIELGTEFYTFVHRSLTVFPVEDDTTVTITDLSDGDDSRTLTLAEGDSVGAYDLFTPVLDTRSGTEIVPRSVDPEVRILSTGDPFDDDYVKVESDKPVLLYVGPAGSDVNEFADVAFSVPTGPESRIIYCYAQNGGGQRDLQIFGFTDDTRVEITSLSYTGGFNHHRHHDFVIEPRIGSGGWLEGTPGSDVWWGYGGWSGELLRIESNRPIVVINGDYDSAHYGAFMPFVVDSLDLPPVADAGPDQVVTAGGTVTFDGADSFDQDELAGPLTPRYEWDLDLAVDSDGDGDPANDLDATGPAPGWVYLVPGDYAVRLTFTDDEGDSDTDQTVVRVEPHPLSLTKAADVESAVPGGEVGYLLRVTNTGDVPAAGVVLRDPLPTHASLSGEVTTTQGTVIGLEPVEVALGSLAPGASAEVEIRVLIDAPLDPTVEQISNAATVAGDGLPPLPSDDPTTPEPFDPTVTRVEAPPVVLDPVLAATKTDDLALDVEGDGVPSPGDEIGYTITVTNTGGGPATEVVLTDLPPEHAAVIPGSVETTAGVLVAESPVELDLGTLGAGESAVITFRVVIDLPVPAGVDRITNQGTVTSAELPAVLTDDPDLGGDADPTVTMITAAPELVAEKSDRLALDSDGDGAVSPGDRVEYTVVVRNVGNGAATGVALADPIPEHTSLVPGSVAVSQGSVTEEAEEAPTLVADLGEIPGGGMAEVRFQVAVDLPIPVGVAEISNQGLVASNELPDLVTDDPEVDGAADPTVTSVVAAPELLVEKTDLLLEDPGGDGVASPGDVLLYRVTVRNEGNTPATGVVLTDPIPDHLTLEAGTVQASLGTVLTEEPVVVEIGQAGQLEVGTEAVVTFRVRVETPFPRDLLEVSNQAEVSSIELPPVLSDDPETAAEADPTRTEVYILPEIAVDDVTVGEASGPAVFTVTLGEPSNRPVTVPFATVDGPGSGTASPAAAGLDYLAARGTLLFAPGETGTTVPVEILDDALDELDETFTLDLGEPEGGVLLDGTGLGTIVDDDPPPFLTIGDATVIEGDPGTGASPELVFPVTLSGPSGLGVAVDWTTAVGTAGRPAESGGDYTPASGTLSLPPGTVSASIHVVVTPDRIDELDETLRVLLSEPLAVILARAEAVGTIVDDDEALLSVGDVRVSEGDAGVADASVPVRLSLESDRRITVDYRTVAGTATEGTDYLFTSGTVAFEALETERAVAVPIVGDRLLEPLEETLTVELSNAGDGTTPVGVEDGSGLVTILDDERCPGPNLLGNAGAEERPVDGELPQWLEVLGDAWQQRFGDPDPAEGEAYFSSGEVAFGELAQDVSVRAYDVRIASAEEQSFSFSGQVRTFQESPPDTARIVVEYRDRTNSVVLDAFDSGEIASPDGWRQVTDERTAPAETGWIRVRLVATRFVGPANDAYFDALELRSLRTATLTVDDATVYEGDAGTTTDATFTVSLSCPVEQKVTVDHATADGLLENGATAGEDYVAGSGSLSFAPGETEKQVAVTVLGDDRHELHEVFTLGLLGQVPAERVVLLDPEGAGLILNDDFCARSHGFWKTHAELWPTDRLEIGGVEYGAAELLGFLEAKGGDVTLHLVRQLVATKLNLLVGSDPGILPVVEDADAYLMLFPAGSDPKKDDRKTGDALERLLDAYNNPRCDETPVIPE